MNKKETKIEYVWSDSAPSFFHKIDPKDVGAEFQILEKQFGKVKPQHIVDRAANKQSALHKFFLWDNHKAAELYRRVQARALQHNLRKIEIIVEKGIQREEKVRVITHVPPIGKQNGGSASLHNLNSIERDRVLIEAKKGLMQWMERNRDLSNQFQILFRDVLHDFNKKYTKK